MRIISGTRRGHKLVSFEGEKIRPTTDRVKESVFNLIQEFIPGSKVLDLFAGSGSLGFEAMSRGAESCVFVDKDIDSVNVVKQNAQSLKFPDGIKILHVSHDEFLKNSKECFDIIFLDPPYNKGFIEPVLSDISKNMRISEEGIVVLESDDSDMHGEVEGLSILKQRKYGRSYITVYQRR